MFCFSFRWPYFISINHKLKKGDLKIEIGLYFNIEMHIHLLHIAIQIFPDHFDLQLSCPSRRIAHCPFSHLTAPCSTPCQLLFTSTNQATAINLFCLPSVSKYFFKSYSNNFDLFMGLPTSTTLVPCILRFQDLFRGTPFTLSFIYLLIQVPDRIWIDMGTFYLIAYPFLTLLNTLGHYLRPSGHQISDCFLKTIPRSSH